MKKYTLIWISAFLIGISSAIAANNRAIEYYNLGTVYAQQGNYQAAIQKLKQAIIIDPTLKSAYYNLSIIYRKQKNMQELAKVCKSITSFQPSTARESIFHGKCYINLGQPDKAIPYYEKYLTYNPKNLDAKDTLEYAKNQIYLQNLVTNMNKAKPSEKAPADVYALVKDKSEVNNDVIPRIQEILDFIWSDPEGKILLKILIENNVPIVIVPNAAKPTTFISGSQNIVEIEVPPINVYNFQDTKISNDSREEAFDSLLHEIGHAVKASIIKKDNKTAHIVNAYEEEIFVSMIADNITSRIFTRQGLCEYTSYIKAKAYLRSILDEDQHDSHRKLPLYNGYGEFIMSLGIKPPYPNFYKNLAPLYKELRNDPSIIRHPELESIINN